jgi:hypothetical protein
MASVFDTLMTGTVVPALATVFGQAGTYTVSDTGAVIVVSAMLQKDVVVVNGLTGASEYRTQIEIASSSLSSIVPRRGDVVTIGTDRWIVLSRDSDDGYLTRLIVRPGDV